MKRKVNIFKFRYSVYSLFTSSSSCFIFRRPSIRGYPEAWVDYAIAWDVTGTRTIVFPFTWGMCWASVFLLYLMKMSIYMELSRVVNFGKQEAQRVSWLWNDLGVGLKNCMGWKESVISVGVVVWEWNSFDWGDRIVEFSPTNFFYI